MLELLRKCVYEDQRFVQRSFINDERGVLLIKSLKKLRLIDLNIINKYY